MATETDTQVGAAEGTERQGLPIPGASNLSTGQAPSGVEAESAHLSKRILDLEKQLKGLQGGLDKRVGKFDNLDQTDLELLLDIAHKAKGDPDTVQKEFIDAKIRRDYMKGSAPISKPESREDAGPGVEQNVREMFAAAGISDEKVMAEVLKPLNSMEYVTEDGRMKPKYFVDLTARIAKSLQAQVQQSQPGNPAAVIAPTGGGVPDTNLEAAYQKEINAAKGQGSAAGRAIREKYRKLGMDLV
jgi:hypothetical protein